MKKRIPISMIAAVTSLGGWGCDTTDTPSAKDSENFSTDPKNTDVDTATFEVDGLFAPESALHDTEADIYLVSNINGGAGAADDNGFISKISPNGNIIELRWIDGAAESIELNAPKGMGIYQDTLIVADITAVRKFDRALGTPIAEIEIPEATFLNDIAVDAEARIYVSDSSGGVVYAIATDGTYRPFTMGEKLPSPNGLTTDGDKLWVATDDAVICFDAEGNRLSTLTPPDGFLDGLVILEDGRLIMSSWDGESVYITSPTSDFQTLFSNISGAADIGFDAKRSLVLIPMLTENTFEVRPLAL